MGYYWHTLRHLRPVQLYGRLLFRLTRPRVDETPAPAPRSAGGKWIDPARRAPGLTGPGEFLLLNEPGTLSDLGWDGPQREKLWRYNQHYFDDLNALDSAQRTEWHRALLTDWISANPPGQGSGWEPYPLSLRLVNWIKWALRGNELPPDCLHSLAVQARWLTGRLEFHLLGNHLFTNAKALVYAGLFFEGEEAERWLRRGLRILSRQVPEQILPDGGHFERSTMYHALALEDMLDLCNLARCYPDVIPGAMVDEWQACLPRMLHWLRAMCHADGEISFFNDAAFGIAPDCTELLAYAQRLGIAAPEVAEGIEHLAASGYVRLARGEALALFDAAPVGPDYLPGHAHADTLSLEMSLFGQRLLVNSGTSQYGTGPERLRQRGTAAHNTVVVNGENSSEVWSGFRVARRAYPHDVVVEPGGSRLRATASHDGYRRLKGRPVHRREVSLADDELEVRDRVDGAFQHAEARFHFHPSVSVTATGNGASLVMPDGQRLVATVEGGGVEAESSTWHPAFGDVERNTCLVIRMSEPQVVFRIQWECASTE